MESKGANFLVRNDSVLAKIISIIPKPKIKSSNDVFFDLMSCILEQQIH
jgi:DNA-3-methyladenine glycosylase II